MDMDLMDKKLRWDIKTLASEPALFYGKISLITLGAYLLGRATK
jgi:hypothetical protein